MKMVGHKTEAIYLRYVIADESMLREAAAKLEALLQAQRGAMRVVVPLTTGKVTAKSAGFDMPIEGVSVAELTERMRSEMVGREGIEPPTPGFSVRLGTPNGRPHSTSSVTIRSIARPSLSRQHRWRRVAPP